MSLPITSIAWERRYNNFATLTTSYTTTHMNTMNKFTAALVTESTKQQIVDLRNETGLSEKELMTLIVNAALNSRDEIIAEAIKIVQFAKIDRANRKAEAYQNLKLKMQQARAEIKAAKQALKEKQEAEMKDKIEADKKPSKKKKSEAVVAE